MADREISSLPKIPQITDESLLPVYVPGSTSPAQAATGKQFADFARSSVSAETKRAETAAAEAEKSKEDAQSASYRAEQSEVNAQDAREAIENMEVRADTLAAGSAATVRKEVVNGVVRLTYGIPEGKQGATGPAGAQGIQGPPGPQGISGVAVAADGQYAFHVNEDGELILSYTGDTAPDMHINEDGDLILTI